MDLSQSRKSPPKFTSPSKPASMEVTSPLKLILEAPSALMSSNSSASMGISQPVVNITEGTTTLEPHVCLLPMASPFSTINSGKSSSVSPLTAPVPGPMFPSNVASKSLSSPMVALSSQLSMRIPPISPSGHAAISSTTVPPPSSPGSIQPVGISGPFGQSSHRSRKEKLICRSGADSMEVQSTAPNPTIEMPDDALIALTLPPITDASSSPAKIKKPSSPTKAPRPHKHKNSSECSQKKPKDPLSKKVLVSNTNRRPGASPEFHGKRPYKRRNTISTSSVSEDPRTENRKLSPSKTTVVDQSPTLKPKSPEKPKVTVEKGGLSAKEMSLMPMLSKQVASTKSPVTLPPPQLTNSELTADKRLADLRMFGSLNVLPIFKPNQKPWSLLKRFLEGRDTDESNGGNTDKHASSHSKQIFHKMEQKVVSNPDIDLIDDTSSDSDTSEQNSTGSESDEEMQVASEETHSDHLEVIAVPFDMDGEDDVVFSTEARALIEQLLVPNAELDSSLSRIHSNRVRTDSESSLPGFNIISSPISAPRTSTPVSGNSNSQSPFEPCAGFQFPAPVTSQVGDQAVSKGPESYQFKPIQRETPSSPSIGSYGSKWPWTQNGRESPGSMSRYQPPSPSPSTMSGSSANGGSGRRYSRRRHSRMYPAFETSHCMYSKHFCPAPLEPGSTYCIKHVSEKYSPYYVRCAFMSSTTGRRCPNMQYSRDGKNKFCNMHASRLALLRHKLCRQPRPTHTPKEHFGEMRRLQNKLKKPKRTEAATYLEDYCDYKLQTQCMENEIEEVDTPEINISVEGMSRFQVEHDSDGGCEVQDEYECLKNAGYYTTEEVVRILKSKLGKLRQLYLNEFDSLKLYYILKRQEYLQAEDAISNSTVRVSRNPKTLFKWKDLVTGDFIKKEMKIYEKTKALLNYHKLRGQSAVLHHLAKKRYENLKSKELRRKHYDFTDDDMTDLSDDANPILRDFFDRCKNIDGNSTKSKAVCKFDDGIIKCENVSLPSSDFCRRHILQDENQVLFQPCNYPMDNKEFCQNPLVKKIDRSGCDFHRSFRLKRFRKSKEENKHRNKLLRAMPSASLSEHVTMLKELVASKFNSVEEFDAEVKYLEGKGLDCSDTSNSDVENDYEVQVDDDEEETPEKIDLESKTSSTATENASISQGLLKVENENCSNQLMTEATDNGSAQFNGGMPCHGDSEWDLKTAISSLPDTTDHQTSKDQLEAEVKLSPVDNLDKNTIVMEEDSRNATIADSTIDTQMTNTSETQPDIKLA